MALIIVVYVLLFLFFRPCVFVVLDTGNRIHLWDLGAGDIYPVHGVEFDDNKIAELENEGITFDEVEGDVVYI